MNARWKGSLPTSSTGSRHIPPYTSIPMKQFARQTLSLTQLKLCHVIHLRCDPRLVVTRSPSCWCTRLVLSLFGRYTQGHSTLDGSKTNIPTALRSRYLRTMESKAGAVPWNNTSGVRIEGGDDGSISETESVELPQLSEGRTVTPSVPRLLSDLSDTTLSPRTKHLDIGRSHSLSSVGMGTVSGPQVSRFSFESSPEGGPTEGHRKRNRRQDCHMSFRNVVCSEYRSRAR